jgi:hypothetical protein
LGPSKCFRLLSLIPHLVWSVVAFCHIIKVLGSSGIEYIGLSRLGGHGSLSVVNILHFENLLVLNSRALTLLKSISLHAVHILSGESIGSIGPNHLRGQSGGLSGDVLLKLRTVVFEALNLLQRGIGELGGVRLQVFVVGTQFLDWVLMQLRSSHVLMRCRTQGTDYLLLRYTLALT